MTDKAPAWCGIDVSQKTFDAGLVLDQPVAEFFKTPSKKFNRSLKGVDEFTKWLTDRLQGTEIDLNQIGIVMEATGNYSLELCAYLTGKQDWHTVAIVNPRTVKHFIISLGLRNQNDQIDARALGFFGRERTPTSFTPQSPAHKRLRELVRYRSNLVHDKTADTLRLSESKDKFIVKNLKMQVKSLEKLIKKCEKEIREVISGDEQLKADAKLLRTMRGVGPVTSWTVLGELGDLRRFRKSRQLSAMAGLSPGKKDSGTSVRGKAKICKEGGGAVRRVLYMGAMAAIGADNDFSRCYVRLVSSGMKKKSALCAVMRKMLVVMRAMVISGTPFYANQSELCEVVTSGI